MSIDRLLKSIVRALSNVRFHVTDEIELHSQLENALSDMLITSREYRLDAKNRIDFLVEDFDVAVGVEVKVKGTKKAIYRQLERYATFPTIDALVLVTAVAIGLPATINGKPLVVVSLGRAWL